jgi:hypothetical protein
LWAGGRTRHLENLGGWLGISELRWVRPDLARWIPWVATAVVVAIVSAAVIVSVRPELLESLPGGSDTQRGPRRSASRGGSCDALEDARAALQDGRYHGATASLKEAEREAIEALDTSWIRFGKPEELALRLNADRVRTLKKRTEEKILAKLDQAREACEGLAS